MSDDRTVLISGAGVAGPVLGWWLAHYGFRPTIVERADTLRTGGQPVDLWGSAVEVAERMGVLPALKSARTRNDKGLMIAPKRKPFEMDLGALLVELGGHHVEILRGELVSILYEAGKADIEYIFGDTIIGLEEHSDRVGVTFATHAPRDFALVVGADGQHSNVRRISFGEGFSRYIGGYICGYTIPNFLGVEGTVLRYVAPGKTVAVLPIRQGDQLTVFFAFRRPEPLDLDLDDVEEQKRLLRSLFGEDGWEVPRLLGFLDDAREFYFDALSQICMDSWVKARIALVGDAGYGPGPAVGGGTSLAVVGAYILAGELAEAQNDPARGLRNYEASLHETVVASRQIGPANMKTLMPSTEFEITLSFILGPLLVALPSLRRLIPVLPRKADKGLRAIADLPIRDYQGR